MKCPPPEEWLQLVDGELAERRARACREHALGCAACDAEHQMARDLIERLGETPELSDADGFVERLMARVAAHERGRPSSRRAPWWPLAVAATLLTGVAAGVWLAFPGVEQQVVQHAPRAPIGEFAPRGASHHDPLALVRVRVLTLDAGPVEAGTLLDPGVAFTVGYRNPASAPAHLMVFAVDSAGVLHWLYPAYLDATQDPLAVRLEPTRTERLMPDSVVLEDVAPGALTLVTLLSDGPLSVSEIEPLPAAELRLARLRERFPAAHVDAVVATVKGKR